MRKAEKQRIARMGREDVEGIVRELCLASIRLDEAQARLNETLARAREMYEPEIAALQAQHKELFEIAQVWADAHPELFASRKSLVMVHGTLLYRSGKPTLKTLAGVTWDKVLALLKAMAPEYVKTTQAIEKAKIISDRAALKDRMRDLGLRIDQAERFDVDLNKDSVEADHATDQRAAG